MRNPRKSYLVQNLIKTVNPRAASEHRNVPEAAMLEVRKPNFLYSAHLGIIPPHRPKDPKVGFYRDAGCYTNDYMVLLWDYIWEQVTFLEC